MTNKWNFIPPRPEVLLNRNELVEVTGYSPVTCQLLVQRGIATLSEVKKFFRPNLFNLHDPYLMPDMEKAVLRLNKAIGNKERILVYGDYDVDGTTAVTLVYKYLRNITSYIDYYIPDRDGEGSGISFKGIDYAAERNITLIITLDCGIKAVDKIKYAKEKGIDTIICDHHKPDETLPDATAILNPLCYGSTYPYEHLSGCGVGFKFMQAFALSNDMPFATLEKMLELVALSIAADIVPITGENRILAYYGLRQLNLNPSLGIKGIIDVCGLAGKELTINDVVFKIGPRINASGRMMNARETVELLLARDSASAREKSENVNKYNDERRELDKKITDQANAILDELNNNDDQKAVILYDPNWRSGVIGIVASRLSEKYYKPAVVFTRSTEPGMITGSARSTNSFDVYRAVESCNDVLENFGGHTYAVGLSIKEERLQDFIERFLAYADKEIHADQMVPQIDIDAHIPFSSITPKLTAELRRMNPFGPHNQKPVFYTSGVKDFGLSKLVGKELEHIKLELIDKTVQTPVQAIAFGMSQHLEHIKSNKPFDICYTIEENNFAGAVSIQLLIKDIRTEAG